jgi:hypothetical protein
LIKNDQECIQFQIPPGRVYFSREGDTSEPRPNDLVGFFALDTFGLLENGEQDVFRGAIGEQAAIFSSKYMGKSRNNSALSINYGWFMELAIQPANIQQPWSLRDRSIGFALTIGGVHRDQIVHVGLAVIADVNRFDQDLAIALFTAPPGGPALLLALIDVANWLFQGNMIKVNMFPDKQWYALFI